MIIIIEGPDGAGKTTLANYLSKKMGYPIKHRSTPKSQEEKDAMMQSYIDDIASGDSMIWDRCFYSEMVYGPVKRDQSYINVEQMVALEVDLQRVGALVIYCTDDVLSLWERCLRTGEKYITNVDELSDIVDRYEKLMIDTVHLIPIVRYEVAYGYVPKL